LREVQTNRAFARRAEAATRTPFGGRHDRWPFSTVTFPDPLRKSATGHDRHRRRGCTTRDAAKLTQPFPGRYAADHLAIQSSERGSVRFTRRHPLFIRCSSPGSCGVLARLSGGSLYCRPVRPGIYEFPVPKVNAEPKERARTLFFGNREESRALHHRRVSGSRISYVEEAGLAPDSRREREQEAAAPPAASLRTDSRPAPTQRHTVNRTRLAAVVDRPRNRSPPGRLTTPHRSHEVMRRSCVPAETSTSISAAQIHAGRTGEQTEYARYAGCPPARPARTWIHRYARRLPTGSATRATYPTDFRRGALAVALDRSGAPEPAHRARAIGPQAALAGIRRITTDRVGAGAGPTRAHPTRARASHGQTCPESPGAAAPPGMAGQAGHAAGVVAETMVVRRAGTGD
jgi:hypothetical protein